MLEDGYGMRCARLSLDDFYLTRAQREELARTQHPLLRTRGVPGTHDVALGQRTIDALAARRRRRRAAAALRQGARRPRA